MALNLGFFNNPKHRVFDYQPRYYDARKEALDEKIQAAHREHDGDRSKDRDYISGRNIRGKIQKKLYYNRKQAGSVYFNRIIVFVTLIGLVAVLYYVAKLLGVFFQ